MSMQVPDDEDVPEQIEEQVSDPADVNDSLKELQFGHVANGSGGQDRTVVDTMDNWFPGEDEWSGKTTLQNMDQAVAFGVVSEMAEHFDWMKDCGYGDDELDTLLRDLKMLFTSVQGEARKDHVDVLRGLMESNRVERDTVGKLMSGFSAGDDDE